jgi:hypothetical protein
MEKDTMTPTQEQIDDQIKRLAQIKPSVSRYAFFDDQDNHAAIEAQIAVLKGEIDATRLEMLASDHEQWAARDALNWLAGNWDAYNEGGDDLVATWTGVKAK